MEMYCEQCKKVTNFAKTKDSFYRDAIVQCTVCNSLHAVPINSLPPKEEKK